jgi:hypothetical protein
MKMSLENWANNSWLERRDSDAEEIARLTGQVPSDGCSLWPVFIQKEFAWSATRKGVQGDADAIQIFLP